jgi:pSer/pThr/pTyr-binding forkhead associated (FHA) protein
MLAKGVTHVGRADDNDLILSDVGVSRRHARIVVAARGATIEDMGSGNGTFYQGQRVQRQVLQDGDEILVDPFILRFRIHEDEADNDGITAELEDVDDDDTVRVSLRSSPAQETEERPALAAPLGQLVTLVGQRLQEQYTIEGSLTLGRSEARDVILFDPAASRNHAAIEYVGSNFWLRDDGSANGTFVNSSRVREQCLRDGDRVRIGGTEFRFEIHTPAAAAGWIQEQETRVRGMERQPLLPPPADSGPAPDSRPPLGPVRLAVIAGVGGFLVVAMMILGGFITLQLMGDSSQEVVATVGEPAELDPEVRTRVDQLMERGGVHFDAGRYLDAAAQYYSVLKLAPGHRQAQRRGYIACELLMVETLRGGLELRNMSDEDKKARRLLAIRVARKALQGKGSLEAAWLNLREVAIFAPQDQKLMELLQSVETLRASGG